MKNLPVKPTIKFSDLEKIDIRVETIEKVEDVEKSDKLVRLTVNFGDFTRKILVGMKKERENPKEIKGKQALFVVNLEPRKMMDEYSEGMIFDIGYANDLIPVLAMPEKPVPNGICAG
ncbi:tRNA-binding protein [Candidatus Microgenomates bacterium]|nr:tRNA-binding protein [Candidatus Microgenomates bacterium]